MSKIDFDVGIIGGGPGGSATAAYLAQAGLKCVILERALFPRPHVGESLVPSSTRVFKEIGFLDQMEQAGFPKKYGAIWTASSKSPVYQHDWEGLEADCHAGIRFEERPQLGVDLNYTYHVDRGKFDLLLLQHAHALGAAVYEGVTVQRVDFTESASPRIQFTMGTKSIDLDVRMVVDASGRRTLLGNQLKLKVKDPVFNQYAIHTWFSNYNRLALATEQTQENYIFVHFLPISNSWIWQIPISNDITSIGVVTQKEHVAKSKESREQFFWECMRSRPELYDSLKAATQLRPLTDEGDYSYAMKEICGDGFVMVGDAARFVDPIFSTGVSIALNSARFASDDIIKAAEHGAFTKDQFAAFEQTLRWGTRNWYTFISLYYRLNVLFTAFIQDPKYRMDIIKLLQGDVYEEAEPEVLTRMKRVVAEVEQNEKHLWHGYLGDLKVPTLSTTF